MWVQHEDLDRGIENMAAPTWLKKGTAIWAGIGGLVLIFPQIFTAIISIKIWILTLPQLLGIGLIGYAWAAWKGKI